MAPMKVEDVVSVSTTTNFSTATTIPCPVNQIFTRRFLPAVYLIVSLLGLLGNGLGLWNLCAGSRRRSWSTLSVLVCNLGVADLLYVITLPFLVTYYLQGGVWLFGKGCCRLMRALFHLNLYASIGFLTCISIHRYLGIVYPLKMLGRCQTLGPPFFISALVWAWVIIQVSPDFGFSKTDSNGTRCHDTTGHENLGTYLPYVLAVTMTGFVIPFLIIISCYCHVVVVLWKNKNVDPNLKRRSIKLAVLVMALFSVCFLPYHVFRNLNLLSRSWQLQGSCTQTSKNIYVSYQVTRGLASFNSALNPLLYLMTSEDCVSCMRPISQRAGQSLGSLRERRTQRQSEQRKTSIILCEEFEEACDEL
ncbi:Purinergic Receptor P2Y1-like [Chelydra serpentina]|uniref:Purinergic Receptor P2Y1-like n=1 Tax=Chelydra serpentina TaxID=8475 RepID=A0A8T1SZB6_CHESE|nr:Purinergic Receptor P2Y1-like [Chelydra serpentina]